MDAKISLLAFAVVALAVSGCATPAGGQWPQKGVVSPRNAPPPATTVQDDKLIIAVAPERSRYLVGEPVYVAVRLRNSGDRAERVVGSLFPEDGAVDLVIVAPDGREYPFVPLGEADIDESIYRRIAPGETIGNIVPIFYGGRGWTFREPGTYRIVVYYRLPAGKGKARLSKSAPAVIEVAPSSEGKAVVGEKGPVSADVGKFLTWQSGDHLDKGQARLREIIERSPDSPLASYAHFALGRNLSNPFKDYRKRVVRAPDCATALSHLLKVNDAHITDYVRAQIAIARGRCAALEKDAKSATQYFNAAKSIMADRPEYQALIDRVSEYQKYLAR